MWNSTLILYATKLPCNMFLFKVCIYVYAVCYLSSQFSGQGKPHIGPLQIPQTNFGVECSRSNHTDRGRMCGAPCRLRWKEEYTVVEKKKRRDEEEREQNCKQIELIHK
jgi:hypothetical protein